MEEKDLRDVFINLEKAHDKVESPREKNVLGLPIF